MTHLPKSYKNIKDVPVYLDSKDFAHNLITYPNGSPATMDIDAIHMNKYRDLIVLEQKQDYDGYIYIPHAQRDVYDRLSQVDFTKVYLVGTHNYQSLEPTDMIYYCDIEDLGHHVRYEEGLKGIKIKMDELVPVPKYQFSEEVQSERIAHFKNLKLDN